jgi:hypothetical protein
LGLSGPVLGLIPSLVGSVFNGASTGRRLYGLEVVVLEDASVVEKAVLLVDSVFNVSERLEANCATDCGDGNCTLANGSDPGNSGAGKRVGGGRGGVRGTWLGETLALWIGGDTATKAGTSAVGAFRETGGAGGSSGTGMEIDAGIGCDNGTGVTGSNGGDGIGWVGE